MQTPSKKISPQMRLLERCGEAHNTPKSSGSQTPLRGGRFPLLPVVYTPPLAAIKRVVNPFEAALTERLHLPAIGSPSLFHRPNTPPHSSTQFEWTMEQISVLNPATIEAHETQFLNSPDPDVEARAQEAISTYFREKHVVPSPKDCSVRAGKVLYRCDGENAAENILPQSGKRNGVTQTILTLPPKLPPAIEAALAPFFSYTMDQQQPLDGVNEIYDQEKIDASLRRQLFGEPEHSEVETDLDGEEVDAVVMPPPQKNWTDTPENWCKKFRGRNFDSPHDRRSFSPNLSITPIKKETFGSLSPIGKLSATGDQQKARSSTSSIYQSTPERGSEHSMNLSSPEEVDGGENDRVAVEKTVDMSFDDEPMQMSQGEIAIHETPMRSRSASRKNLSHSFSQMIESDDAVEFFGRFEGKSMDKPPKEQKYHQGNFTRTDSGFNDASCDMDNKENLDPTAGSSFPLTSEKFDNDISMVVLPGITPIDSKMMISSTPRSVQSLY
ncbi:Protein aurora borealis [Sergentomyia squamirostris]